MRHAFYFLQCFRGIGSALNIEDEGKIEERKERKSLS